MAQIKYSSLETLTAYTNKVKALLANKVDKQEGYTLTKNDLTDTLKQQYDAAYAHSQSAHAPSDAERNVIVTVKVNGVAETPDGDRAVDIEVPTTTSELTNDSGFQTSEQVSGAITSALGNYYNKGETDSAIAAAVSAASHLKREIVETLPEADQDENTIYMLAKDSPEGQDVYTEYMWINGKWEIVGDTTVDLSNYVTTTAMNQAIATALQNYVQTSDLVAITSQEVDALFA